MSDPITHCLARLNLEDDIKVKQRTQEFHGQLSSVPAKFFDSGPNLKVVVCIQLAYERYGSITSACMAVTELLFVALEILIGMLD